MSAIQESVKEMSVEELLALIAVATAEAKKKLKAPKDASKTPKEPKAKKAGSMVKGVLPPQLHESFAWVDYVLADAKANGWMAYSVKGKEEHEEASEVRNGVHVFPTTGKEFNRKNAMSLSKFYYSKKEASGANEALYQKFAAQYVPVVVSPKAEAATAEVADASPKTPSKAPNAAMQSVSPKATPKAPKEAKAANAAMQSVSPKATSKEPKAPKKEPKAASKAATKEEDEWLAACPKDDAVYPWEFKGVQYARNHKNHVYMVDEDGEPTYWAGIFNGKKIDSSAAEPMDE